MFHRGLRCATSVADHGGPEAPGEIGDLVISFDVSTPVGAAPVHDAEDTRGDGHGADEAEARGLPVGSIGATRLPCLDGRDAERHASSMPVVSCGITVRQHGLPTRDGE